MYRIAHISDLHVSNLDSEQQTNLQWLGDLLLQAGNISVEADNHDLNKLGALKNSLRLLRPNLIIVTGDITNYGDAGSFTSALEILRDLLQVSKAERVICIPGNHDSLSERVAALRKKGVVNRLLLWGLAKVNPTAARIRETSFDRKVKAQLDIGDALPLLRNFATAIANLDKGEVNPSKPCFVKTPWADLALFLFNSTNDPGYMANEGRIGQFQYNLLNEFLDDPAQQTKTSRAVRIALLHHHPINNPNIDADAIERGYNSMSDGSLFMTYLGKRKFHFILHGHQHVPYCWKSHPELGAHIISAGSATAGSDPTKGSFNVIDLITPFEAVYRRFDYSRTGYAENIAEKTPLLVKSLDGIRITPADHPLGAEDLAIRTLFGMREEAYDEDHEYELLEYNVKVSPDQLYQGRYRRKGKYIGERPGLGLTFVITGSPPMKTEDMGIVATDDQEHNLNVAKLRDYPTQKVLRVNYYTPLVRGQAFDITLEFKWQASVAEPNDFDGVNLMYFHHPVGALTYSVNLPWLPTTPRVIAYALEELDPQTKAPPSLVQQADGTYTFSFEIPNPQPLAYLIWFRKA
jgi:predicted phosphodiesterase